MAALDLREQALRDAAERILALSEPAATAGESDDASLGPLANVAYRPHPAAQDITCNTPLPDGNTVGDYVRHYRAILQQRYDEAVTSMRDNSGNPFGGVSGNPLGNVSGAFGNIVRDNGPIDFKNKFPQNKSGGVNLGHAGNFAYYAIGSGFLPDAELDIGAGAYGISKLFRKKAPLSSLTGRMYSDDSARSQREAGLAANGCRP